MILRKESKFKKKKEQNSIYRFLVVEGELVFVYLVLELVATRKADSVFK